MAKRLKTTPDWELRLHENIAAVATEVMSMHGWRAIYECHEEYQVTLQALIEAAKKFTAVERWAYSKSLEYDWILAINLFAEKLLQHYIDEQAIPMPSKVSDMARQAIKVNSNTTSAVPA